MFYQVDALLLAYFDRLGTWLSRILSCNKLRVTYLVFGSAMLCNLLALAGTIESGVRFFALLAFIVLSILIWAGMRNAMLLDELAIGLNQEFVDQIFRPGTHCTFLTLGALFLLHRIPLIVLTEAGVAEVIAWLATDLRLALYGAGGYIARTYVNRH